MAASSPNRSGGIPTRFSCSTSWRKPTPTCGAFCSRSWRTGCSPTPTGKRADFRNTVIVMTSNVGGERLSAGTPLGFSTGEASDAAETAALQRELRQVFRPEFLNRLDEIVFTSP